MNTNLHESPFDANSNVGIMVGDNGADEDITVSANQVVNGGICIDPGSGTNINIYVLGNTVGAYTPSGNSMYATDTNGLTLSNNIVYVDAGYSWIYIDTGVTGLVETNNTIITATGVTTTVFSVVRGTNNGVYYGSNVAGSWTGWIALPGATSGAPAAVQCGGELYLAVQGTDNGIYFGYLNPATDAFSGWTAVPGGTSSGPGLAADSSCNLYMAIRGTNNEIYLNTYTGGTWQGWTQLPGGTSDSPGVAVTASTIYLAIRGTNNGIYFGTIPHTGTTIGSFSGWTSVVGATVGRPGLVAVSDSQIYMTVQTSDNGIYLNEWIGASWAGWVELPGGVAASGPAVTVSNGTLYLMVQGTDNGIYWSSGTYGGSWSAWKKIPGATSSSPTLA
jgi:hypothetical protein